MYTQKKSRLSYESQDLEHVLSKSHPNCFPAIVQRIQGLRKLLLQPADFLAGLLRCYCLR
jgi:hypothetical protein